jgi:hypothetical protein
MTGTLRNPGGSWGPKTQDLLRWILRRYLEANVKGKLLSSYL